MNGYQNIIIDRANKQTRKLTGLLGDADIAVPEIGLFNRGFCSCCCCVSSCSSSGYATDGSHMKEEREEIKMNNTFERQPHNQNEEIETANQAEQLKNT